MKWSAENDQLLFLKLIETHDVSVKPQKIQEAWPRDGREVPTARAISERIAKLRNVVKTTSTSAASSLPASSTQTTPRKRKKVQVNGEKGSSESNGHLDGETGKEHEPGRKRRGPQVTPPGLAKGGLEDGSFTSSSPGFGIFGAERLGGRTFLDESFKAEKCNPGEEGEGQRKEETN
ncbi:unnamed protein product [Tuber aestivum]|uniref:Uncharacterized protein n=1 Tax=Tuber aestivum TaxID=59557 RepID=A0A292PTK3_9PEZI|nr:unnamed protein product [Tuber aestivum]